MTTTFKEYRKLKNLPLMQTWFGYHSEPDPVGIMQTSFGSHSQESVNEAARDHVHLAAEQERIHEKVAPLHESKLSSRELASVVDYTDDSSDLNKSLYEHSHRAKVPEDKIVEHSNALESALSKHKTTEPTHVFTGLRRSPAEHFAAGAHDKPTRVHVPAFISASTTLNKARTFATEVSHRNDAHHGISGMAQHMLKIHMPAGTSAASMKSHSFIPGENEILLNRGHHLEIDPHPEHLGSDMHLWNARVVEHKPVPLK